MAKLIELIEAAHVNSTAHGFWEGEENRDLLMKVNLLHSELSEMLEEYRLSDEKRGGALNEIVYEWDAGRYNPHDDGAGAPPPGAKPVGFLVEAVDVAIRIYDLLGWLRTSASGAGADRVEYATMEMYESARELAAQWSEKRPEERRFAYALFKAHTLATSVGDSFAAATGSAHSPQHCISCYVAAHNALISLLVRVERIALLVGAGPAAFENAVAVKMAYNQSRPMRHGKRC